jgi:hypothetical protein
MLLKIDFLGDSGRSSCARSLGSCLILAGSFLARLRVGFLLRTYVLYCLKRGKKQTHVPGSHAFLVEVELILPQMWTHTENVHHQISLREWSFCRLHTGIVTRAVDSAWQLHNVGVELIYALHKLTHTNTLGFLEHVRKVVLFLLCRIVGKHGEKVKHHAVIK